MKHTSCLTLFAILAPLLLAPLLLAPLARLIAADAPKQKPNILVILADDLASDVKEANDLIAHYPETAKELLTCFEAWNRTLPPVGPSFKDTTEGEEQESKTRK